MRRPRFPPSTTSPAPEPHNIEKIAWIDACHSRSYSVFCCRATNLLPLTSRFRLTAASRAFGAMISGLNSIGSIRACCRECFGRSFGKVIHTLSVLRVELAGPRGEANAAFAAAQAMRGTSEAMLGKSVRLLSETSSEMRLDKALVDRDSRSVDLSQFQITAVEPLLPSFASSR